MKKRNYSFFAALIRAFFNGDIMLEYFKNHKTSVILSFVAILLIIASLIIVVTIYIRKKTRMQKKDVTRRMVTIAIFSGLSILFYKTLKFPLPIFPSFLEINFSNLPIIIGSFMLGPIEGIIMVIIRTVIALPLTHTFCVGELADLIISASLVLVGATIYNKKRNKKRAIISLIFIFITWITISIIANYAILVPAYITLFYGGNLESFISTLTIIPSINENNYMLKYLTYAVIPFNIILSFTVCFITLLVYKKISILFHKFDNEEKKRYLEF